MTPLTAPAASATASHCPYCALQCAMTLTRTDAPAGATGGPRRPPSSIEGRDFPTNRGGLCKKGWTAAEVLVAPDRLRTPLCGTRTATCAPHRGTRRSTSIAGALSDDPRRARRRRRRRVRRRWPHQREGLPARQVRPPRPGHEPHRLQRPVLHVLGRGGRQPGVRHRPGAPVPARAPRRGIHDPPARHERRRDDAAVRRSPRGRRRPPAGSSSSTRAAPRRRGSPTRAAASTCSPPPAPTSRCCSGITHVVLAEGLADDAYLAARTNGVEALRRSVAGWWPERVQSVTGVPVVTHPRGSRGGSPRAAGSTSSPAGASSSTSTAPTPRPRRSTWPSSSGCRAATTPDTAP